MADFVTGAPWVDNLINAYPPRPADEEPEEDEEEPVPEPLKSTRKSRSPRVRARRDPEEYQRQPSASSQGFYATRVPRIDDDGLNWGPCVGGMVSAETVRETVSGAKVAATVVQKCPWCQGFGC